MLIALVSGAESQSWDDADWGWRDEEDEEKEKGGQDNKNNDRDNYHSWLQECSISLSPTGDFMAVAHSEKLVILSRKCNALGVKINEDRIMSDEYIRSSGQLFGEGEGNS